MPGRTARSMMVTILVMFWGRGWMLILNSLESVGQCDYGLEW